MRALQFPNSGSPAETLGGARQASRRLALGDKENMNIISEWSARLILLLGLLLIPASTTWAAGGAGGCSPGVTCVPEPASLTLLGVGVGAILLYRNRRGPKK